MKLDESKIYTTINAGKLRPGDKVIVADNVVTLRDRVKKCVKPDEISYINSENNAFRFMINGCTRRFALAYLVEKAE